MTQEEKFKEAKRLYKTANADQRYVLESLFPELMESEDERTRESLLEYLHTLPNHYTRSGVCVLEWIAWLEKQAQKPTDKVEPKFKVGDKIYLKPEYRMPDDDTPIANTVFEIRAIDDKHYRFDGSYIFIEDQDKYELVEQRPAAWSEEDEVKIKSIIALLKEPAVCAMDGNKGIIDASIKYLKSLKERVQSQSQWKPSDEQMTALRRMKAAIAGEGEIYKPLNSLYEELKKLMEE